MNLNTLAHSIHWNYSIELLSWALPIGLSFHTFQSLSYVIEIYRGRQPAEKHFGIYALYVMFFPQLVAGPIERPQNMLHQFYEKHFVDASRIIFGLELMLWGFFKKIVIADRLALTVNPIFNNVHDYNGLSFILGMVFFSFQIYCDFSGYTDIALGSAKVLGFRLMDNFKQPYFSVSISEFWNKWHISLSSWFRDYVYIPLGGSRVSPVVFSRNILITFLLSGLWHGANWTFIAWGGLHGIYYIISKNTLMLRKRLLLITRLNQHPSAHRILQISVTFSLVTIAWVFFRASSFTDAFYILSHLSNDFSINHLMKTIPVQKFALNACLIGILVAVDVLISRNRNTRVLESQPWWIRWSIYYFVIFSIILLGVYDVSESSPFIYFQF
ncbi:MAG: MBOAT family O-acyltransferase [Syntrophomonas sp.]